MLSMDRRRLFDIEKRRFSEGGNDAQTSWAIFLALFVWAPAWAAPADMFRGKTITYIVATTPGGGYDTYGRLIALYLQKYLPGSRIVVKNVPGAGNIIGANTIYAARPDGLTIGMFNTGLIYDQLVKRNGVMFDLTKMSWLGKAAEETRVLLISKKAGFKSFDEMRKARGPIKFAASGVGAASYNDTRISPMRCISMFRSSTASPAMKAR
jgi:tripartite-type tricarboxylate transporter receptor subunit TctC